VVGGGGGGKRDEVAHSFDARGRSSVELAVDNVGEHQNCIYIYICTCRVVPAL